MGLVQNQFWSRTTPLQSNRIDCWLVDPSMPWKSMTLISGDNSDTIIRQIHYCFFCFLAKLGYWSFQCGLRKVSIDTKAQNSFRVKQPFDRWILVAWLPTPFTFFWKLPRKNLYIKYLKGLLLKLFLIFQQVTRPERYIFKALEPNSQPRLLAESTCIAITRMIESAWKQEQLLDVKSSLQYY